MEPSEPAGDSEYVPLPQTSRPAGRKSESTASSSGGAPAASAAAPVAFLLCFAAFGSGAWLLSSHRAASPVVAPAAAPVVAPVVAAQAPRAAPPPAAAPAAAPPELIRLAPIEDRPTSPLPIADAIDKPLAAAPPAAVPATPAFSASPPAPAAPAARARPAAHARPSFPEPPTAVTPAYVPDAAGAIAAESRTLAPADLAALFNRPGADFVPWTTQPGAPLMPGRTAAAANPATAPCPDCAGALNSAGTSHVSGWSAPRVGSIAYLGPCDGGYLYRITNQSRITLPPYLVGEDGELWKTGYLGPGQSLDIRAKAPITRAAFARPR